MKTLKKSNLVSKSGRALSELPVIDLTTNRKVSNSIRRLNSWLLDEAKKEADHNNDYFSKVMLKGINLKNITTADRDTINLVLFGETEVEILLKE